MLEENYTPPTENNIESTSTPFNFKPILFLIILIVVMFGGIYLSNQTKKANKKPTPDEEFNKILTAGKKDTYFERTSTSAKPPSPTPIQIEDTRAKYITKNPSLLNPNNILYTDQLFKYSFEYPSDAEIIECPDSYCMTIQTNGSVVKIDLQGGPILDENNYQTSLMSNAYFCTLTETNPKFDCRSLSAEKYKTSSGMNGYLVKRTRGTSSNGFENDSIEYIYIFPLSQTIVGDDKSRYSFVTFTTIGNPEESKIIATNLVESYNRLPIPTPIPKVSHAFSNDTVWLDFAHCDRKDSQGYILKDNRSIDFLITDGIIPEICTMRITAHIMYEDNYLERVEACFIPKTLGDMQFEKNDDGIDLSPLKHYCYTEK